MKAFLESFAAYLTENHFERFSQSCIIFPSKRAGVYFLKHLSELTPKTTFVPEITTLNEFIDAHSDLFPADQLYLLHVLYEVFKNKTGIDESFDEFYFWGQVILSDFNDIDNELADARKLYSNLSDLKQIENTFYDWTDEQVKAIETFWGAIDVKTKALGQQKFLLLWEKLFQVYEEFNKVLDSEKIGYDGKRYRHVAEKFRKMKAGDIEYGKIFIAGFNALSKTERQILKSLKQMDKAEFFWDFDDYYIKNNEHEAGYFLRAIIKEFPAPDNFLFESGIINNNKVHIYASPTQVGQTKILPGLLASSADSEQAAVVLADESLLLPVLYSLPPEISKLNVTMGYPVKQSPSLQMTDALLEFQRNVKKSPKGSYVKVKDVLRILNLPLIKRFSWSSDLKNMLKENIKPVVNAEKLLGDDLRSIIFTPVDTPDNYCYYLTGVISEIMESIHLSSGSDHRQLIEKQVLFSVYRETKKLGELLKTFSIKILKHDTFVRIYKQTLSNVTVAFRGEPLAGLQVMGILETRLLDFKNIVLLSVNEGVLPKSSVNLSLIPYNLRKGFGLLTQEHQDAIFAYHFYHFLQRTENLSLVYCTKQPEGGRGEPSRFIYQIRYDDTFNIAQYDMSDKAGVFIEKPIVINHNEQINIILNKYLSGEKQLSPTSLSSYIKCPLKFYLRYVAGIKAPEEISEGMDGIMFGNILHRTVELLYSQMTGKLVNESDVAALNTEENLNPALENAFHEIVFGGKSMGEITGMLLVNFQILKKYVKKILDYDRQLTPFLLKGFEIPVNYRIPVEMEGHIYDVEFNGFIDRCLEKEGNVIIQDFKTGNVESKAGSLEEIFIENGRKDFSGMRQVFIYSLAMGENQKVKPEIISVRNQLVNENVSLKIKNELVENCNHYKNDFDTLLKSVLIQIFTRENAFSQTTDIKTCEYCDYKQICRR